MPFTYTTPDTASSSYDTAQIESFAVSKINDAAGPVLAVSYTRGNTVEGVYTPVTRESALLQVAATKTKMAEAPNPSAVDIYAVIKTALYELLVSEGHLSAGSVS